MHTIFDFLGQDSPQWSFHLSFDPVISDDGSFLACEDLWGRVFDDSFPTCGFCLFVFLMWRSADACQFHFLGQDLSTVVLSI